MALSLIEDWDTDAIVHARVNIAWWPIVACDIRHLSCRGHQVVHCLAINDYLSTVEGRKCQWPIQEFNIHISSESSLHAFFYTLWV